MKNSISLLLLILCIQTFNAQRFEEINNKLQKLSEKRTWDKGIITDNLVGKKFVTVKSEGTIVIKRILQFEENNKITLIELIEDKKTDNNTSKIYSGDLVKTENNISIRADKLEGKVITVPYTYNFILQRKQGVLYLHNINNNEKWIQTEIVNK